MADSRYLIELIIEAQDRSAAEFLKASGNVTALKKLHQSLEKDIENQAAARKRLSEVTAGQAAKQKILNELNEKEGYLTTRNANAQKSLNAAIREETRISSLPGTKQQEEDLAVAVNNVNAARRNLIGTIKEQNQKEVLIDTNRALAGDKQHQADMARRAEALGEDENNARRIEKIDEKIAAKKKDLAKQDLEDSKKAEDEKQKLEDRLADKRKKRDDIEEARAEKLRVLQANGLKAQNALANERDKKRPDQERIKTLEKELTAAKRKEREGQERFGKTSPGTQVLRDLKEAIKTLETTIEERKTTLKRIKKESVENDPLIAQLRQEKDDLTKRQIIVKELQRDLAKTIRDTQAEKLGEASSAQTDRIQVDIKENFEEERTDQAKTDRENVARAKSVEILKEHSEQLKKEGEIQKANGFQENKISADSEARIAVIREAFIKVDKSAANFNRQKNEAFQINQNDIDAINSAFKSLDNAEQNFRKTNKRKTELDTEGKLVGAQKFQVELDTKQAEQQAFVARTFIEGIVGHIESNVDLDTGEFMAQLPGFLALKALAGRDIHVNIDVDSSKAVAAIGTFGALQGAVAAVRTGLDHAGAGVSSFDNLIRGLLVLTVALFFQQIFVAVIGLVSGLTALASSAIAAGAALGGALVAGIMQAIPAFVVLGAFVNRLTKVFGAVKQANLLQQQESSKSGKAAAQQASSLDAIVAAQERVAEAQKKVTEAREKARQALEDLILSERKQTLSLEESQNALSSAISSGAGSLAVSQAQIGVEESENSLGKTKTDLRSRQSKGISGSPEVTDALKALKDAERGLAQAQQSSAAAAGGLDAAAGKLNSLVGELSKSEKELFKSLVKLQDHWRVFAGKITAPLTEAFTFAVNKIDKILTSSKILKGATSMASALAGSLKRIFNFLLSDTYINRIIAFGQEFEKNLGPLTNILINLLKIFLNIGELANPVLSKLLGYLDDLTLRFANFTSSVEGKNGVKAFFDEGTTALFQFLDLFGALGKVIIALMGPAGGLKAGSVVLKLLIDSFNNLALAIADPESKIGQFFRRFFDYADDILKTFSPIINALAKVIDEIFTPTGLRNTKAFGEFLGQVLIPGLGNAIKFLGAFTTAFNALIQRVPILKVILTDLIGVVIAGAIISKIGALLRPVQTLTAFLFTGVGKKSIFALLGAELGAATSKAKGVLSAIEKSDGIFGRKIRQWATARSAAITAAGSAAELSSMNEPNARSRPKRVVGVGKRVLQGAGFMGGIDAVEGGSAAGIATKFGALLGPVGAVAAIIAVIVAAVVGLLALSGRLDDVWGAIKDTFNGVFESIKQAIGELAKEITGEKSVKAAFASIVDVLKVVGNVLAEILIPAIKIMGAWFGIIIVTIIKRVTAVVKFIKTAFSGIKEFWEGVFSLDFGKIIGGLGKVLGAIATLIIDLLKAPFEALSLVVGNVFKNISTKIESIFVSVINLIITGVNKAIDAINKIPFIGDIEKIKLLDAPEQQRREKSNRAVASGKQVANRNKGAGKDGVSDPALRKVGKATKIDNQQANDFLTSFNPETIKVSDAIVKKLSTLWNTLRNLVRRTSNDAETQLADLKKNGGKSVDRFVTLAIADFRRLRNGVRTNMTGVFNIVANQMQNAKMAVYDGAQYMKKTLNDALDSVGAKDKKLTGLKLITPKIYDGDGQKAATGGWIGNRGERGKDAVHTILGRGEAVLNWGHQKLVEPALRQVYGFGLDGLFSSTKGYHAGGPQSGGMAVGGRPFRTGKASWFGGPNDAMNTSTAIGVPDTTPGIALLNQATLRKYFDVQSPQGRRARLRQIDIGPATWTGKILDITSAAIGRFGFNESNFPTGVGNWKVFGPYGKGGAAAPGGSTGGIKAPTFKGPDGPIKTLVTKGTQKMIEGANKYLDKYRPTTTTVSGGDGGGGPISTTGLVAQVQRALAWARKNGWTGGVNEGFRTFAQQTVRYNQYLAGGNLAAKPGTSNHEFGQAIDVSDAEGFARAMLSAPANARLLRKVPGEPWHFSITGNAQGGFVGLKKFASGGHVGGPEGQAVPIVAHAGEWVVNKMQQSKLAAMAGTSVDQVKGALGFTGGRTFFQGGGTVEALLKATKGVRADSLPASILDSAKNNIKQFMDALTGSFKSLTKIAKDVLTTRALRKNIEDIKSKIKELEKGSETDKEKGQIKKLEETLKGLNARKDFDRFFKSIRTVTGDDGLLVNLAKSIDRTFAKVGRAAKLAALGFAEVGVAVTGDKLAADLSAGADPAKIAEAEKNAQLVLADNLVKLNNSYLAALKILAKKSKEFSSVKKLAGQTKTNDADIDRLKGEIDSKDFKGEDLKDKKKKLKAAEKEKKDLKTRTEIRSNLDTEINKLNDQINENADKYIEALQAAFEAEKTAFNETTTKNLKGAEAKLKIASFNKAVGEIKAATSFSDAGQNEIDKSFTDTSAAAKEKFDVLQARALEAYNLALVDPRWQSIAEDLAGQAQDANLAEQQAVAEEAANLLASFQKRTERATKAFDIQSALANVDKQIAEITGNVSGVVDAIASNLAGLTGKQTALEKALEEAAAQDQSDPRWKEATDALRQQVKDGTLAIFQAQAEVISNAMNDIEKAFQRGEVIRGITERAASLNERRGNFSGAFSQRISTSEGKGTVLTAQQKALQALLDGPGVNAVQREELIAKINDLTQSIDENSQETKDLTLQYRQSQVDRITGVATRTGGLLGSAQSIFSNVARLTGTPDTGSKISLAESLRIALGLENTTLSGELSNFLSTDAGRLGADATGVLAQLLAAFNTNDPNTFAGALQSLAPQISLLDSTLGETARGPFNAFIESLTNNTIATTDNTANLAELNGLASQPQAFSTTAWTRFRAAIFSGVGNVLPQFQIPQMATGGYVTQGGLFQLHPGEFVVNATQSNIPGNDGDINITVNEANKPFDVTALASRIAFEKRTRK